MHFRIYAKTQACSLLSQKAPIQLFGVCLPQEVPASACLSCTLFWIPHNVHCNATQCCSLIGTQTIRPKRRLLLHLGGTQLLLQEVADLRFFCTNLSEIHLATTTSFGTAYSYTATSCVAQRSYNRWQTYLRTADTYIPHPLDWRPACSISIFRIVGLPP